MTTLAPLVLSLLVLNAQAASISGPIEIPVTVVEVPANENLIDNDNLKIIRPEVDLKNPGLPQRQEHETQNPEYYNEGQNIVSSVKQSIQDTQLFLRKGLAEITNDIQNYLTDNEKTSSIQNSVQSLQNVFTTQLKKINSSIQSLWNIETSANVPPPVLEMQANNLRNIKLSLDSLEKKFNEGLSTVSEGIKMAAVQKDDAATAAASASTSTGSKPEEKPTTQEKPSTGGKPTEGSSSSTTNPPAQGITAVIQNLQTQISNAFGGINQAFTQFFQQNQQFNIQNIFQGNNGTQNDDPGTPRPPFWQGIQNTFSYLNPFQPPQTQSDPQVTQAPTFPNGPIAQAAQAIQNIPFIQGVVNFLQPNRQTAQTTPKPATAAPGSNSVPAQNNPQTSTPIGPIKQLINNSPITQAVQRIQHNINNPEKPRDSFLERGGGDNNGSSGVKSDITQDNEEVKDTPVPEVLPEAPKETIAEVPAADKTE